MTMTMNETIYRKSAGEEPLPGYRLISPLGRGGYGEVWKCLAPGGLQKAVKFVAEEPDNEHTPLRQEYEAFLRVKGIRHPFLLMLERVELLGGELIMVMELADQSLLQRFEDCIKLGLTGIPRSELLSYMVDAAEALDVLGRQHKLQHLDVKPANLFVVGGHVKVGDYGLVGRVEYHGTTEGKLQRGLTPKYVAPEVLHNKVDGRTDQYSLALVYQELLTGHYAYPGSTPEQVLFQHIHGTPNLAMLSSGEKSALTKALSKRPQDRYVNCLEFVKALLSADWETPAPRAKSTSALTPTSVLNQTQVYNRAAGEREACNTLSDSGQKTSTLNSTLSLGATASIYGSNPTLRTGTQQADELSRSFPGFTHVADLEAGPRGKVIRAIDSMKRSHTIHFVKNGVGENLDEVLRAAIMPHPAVIQTLAVPMPRTYVFAVSDDWRPLKDYDLTQRASGKPWHRAQFLELLTPIAHALDELYHRCQFPHGLVSLKTIVTKDSRYGLTGFGIAELLKRTQSELDWIADEAHAAPETLRGVPVAASDQYSLALIYAELMGVWKAKDPRASRRSDSQFINYAELQEHEIEAIRRATATQPADRFPSCVALMDALTQRKDIVGIVLPEVRLIESVARLQGVAEVGRPPEPEQYLRALLNKVSPPNYGTTPQTAVKQQDQRWAIKFPVLMNAEMIHLKLSSFIQEHRCDCVVVNNETHVLRFPTVIGKSGVEITLLLPKGTNWNACEIRLLGRTTGGLDLGHKAIPPRLVEHMEQLKRALQPHTDRRKSPRFPVEWPVMIYPVSDELHVGSPVAGKLREISTGGASLSCTQPLLPGHIFLSVPGVIGAEWAILCRILRNGEIVSVQYVAGT